LVCLAATGICSSGFRDSLGGHWLSGFGRAPGAIQYHCRAHQATRP
jgi:hypothetical protein